MDNPPLRIRPAIALVIVQWLLAYALPTIAPDLDYADLQIGNGSDAQLGYLCAISPGTSATEQLRLRQQLLDYCERDTLAMLRLAQWRPT